jgi:hypothetical protein
LPGATPEKAGEGLPDLLHLFVHSNTPHSPLSLYIAAALFSVAAVVAVYVRCMWTGSTQHLEDRWLPRTAAYAAPIPVYFLLMLAPLDTDLVEVMMEDFIIVALAGLYGLSEAINDLRGTAGRAREKVAAKPPPAP